MSLVRENLSVKPLTGEEVQISTQPLEVVRNSYPPDALNLRYSLQTDTITSQDSLVFYTYPTQQTELTILEDFT